MYTRLRKMLANSKDKGFTLIELLVVIVIIGILAAIAIPVFLSQRAKAYDASAKSDVHTIATEMETVYTDTQAYPTAVTPTLNTATNVTTLSFPTGGSGSTPDLVTLSTGNTAAIYVNSATPATAYCIAVTPASGTHGWVYESDNGGLQPNSVTACPTTGTTTPVYTGGDIVT
jgi:prepilin-type N-terminal cleavage/methylation domain-containing protein